ncbi:MAG: CotH kinase family protein, partial [Bacteroidia bacterium]|nr:CotH kinase family protein [Bacteroidia bacterium]
MKYLLYFPLLCFLFFTGNLSRITAQVVINEFSCSNMNGITDSFTEHEDWIELYNDSIAAISLAGYHLSDKASNPTKWTFPNVSIPANGFLLVYASGRDQVVGTEIHTNFKLTQTKPEHVVFTSPTGVILENYETTPTQIDQSRGRLTDGGTTWVIFSTPTPGTSNNGSPSFTDYVPKPLFSVGPGFYNTTQIITMSCSNASAEMRYTTDGSVPTTSSMLYSGPISITTTTVLRARAFVTDPQYQPSFIKNSTYFINVSHSVAVVSIFSDQIQNLLNGNYITPQASLEYFDKTHVFRTEADGYANKHGNDSWAYGQRGIDFITRDQLGYNYALNYKLFARKNRTEFQRIILKACANDNYPFETGGAHIRDAYVETLAQDGHLDLDVRTYEPCILYVNGQYWGVYDMREKVDDADFTDYYYNQDEFHVQMLKTWGGTWSEFGGAQAQTDWNTFRNFVTSNNMAITANYNQVKNQYDIRSLIDYFVLNSYVVCSDWLNWNTEWWRGLDPNGSNLKWKYNLWDEDATFGHYINYTGIPSQLPTADPCNPQNFNDPGGQGHVPILNALLNNPEFYQYYVARFADLANTTFSCPHMHFMLDSMINLITPEMPAHIAKWGGSMSEWQANVTALYNFIDQRCAELAGGMINCYSLTGPYDITVNVDPPGSGFVELNSLYLINFPWTGQYYGGLETLLRAHPASSNYVLDHWELTNTPLPDAYSDTISTTFTSAQTVIAHFKSIIPVVNLG